MSKKHIQSFIVKSLLIVFALIGLFLTFFAGGFMKSSAILYFTVQSNIWILSIVIVFLIFEIVGVVQGQFIIPYWLKIIKFIFTSAITLTFIVFSLMLAPLMPLSYLLSVSNLCVHFIVPILALVDWFMFDCNITIKKGTFLYGIIMPLYYCIFALIASTTSINYGEGKKVPYFFFDYTANTWFSIGNGKIGTFYWIMLLVGIVFLISWSIIHFTKKIADKNCKSQNLNLN